MAGELYATTTLGNPTGGTTGTVAMDDILHCTAAFGLLNHLRKRSVERHHGSPNSVHHHPANHGGGVSQPVT
jgi:hypothetical protein